MKGRVQAIQKYIAAHFCQETPETQLPLTCGLKSISVPQSVARVLYLFVKMVKPRRVLEIGTLAGYSSLWIAKGLEDGAKLISIEANPSHFDIARANVASAGALESIELRCADATALLYQMVEEGEEPFDFVFIDADKAEYLDYLEPVIQLTRSGGVILADNVIPKRGEIGVPDARDSEAIEIYTFNQMLSQDPRLEAHILPTLVGEMGRIDGLALAVVK